MRFGKYFQKCTLPRVQILIMGSQILKLKERLEIWNTENLKNGV